MRLPVLVLVLLAACAAAPSEAPELPDADVMGLLTADRVVQYRALEHWCTAFAVGPTQALTARHCIGTRGQLHGADGGRQVVGTAMHPTADVALLTVDRPFGAWFELSEYDAPDLHSRGYSAGYGCDGSVRAQAFTFDASQGWWSLVCNGDSGAPVLDASGRVVGILSATAEPDSVAQTWFEALGDWRGMLTGGEV